ncbi:hypothetical protein [Shimazuella kribbensis]|uniref:hypothetical protein n=1 Tax=Shimazuella kribbensis TaxID=139808 RepID=UPI0004902B77|nr:hypothetical protein [Shimazuella kribbensis]
MSNAIERNHVEHNTVDNVEAAQDDRNKYLDAMIEVERLRGEINALAPYKQKYLKSIKAELLKQFNVDDDMLAVIDEKLHGEDEIQLKTQAELLTIELRVNKVGTDPTMKNPATRKPTNNSANSLYEQGKDAINKARGWRNEKQISKIHVECGKRIRNVKKLWWQIW